MNDAVFHRDASRGRHGGDEAVFLESRPILRANQIVAHAAQLRRYTAPVFQRNLGIEWESSNRLFETSWLEVALGLGHNGSGGGAGQGCRCNEFSASHAGYCTNCPLGPGWE